MATVSNIAPLCQTTSTGPSGRACWKRTCGETSAVSSTTITYRDTSANVSGANVISKNMNKKVDSYLSLSIIYVSAPPSAECLVDTQFNIVTSPSASAVKSSSCRSAVFT